MAEDNEFSIPPLSEKLVNCISYMYKSNFNYDVLSQKISTDIGLSEKVLILANSQFFSQGAPKTNNLKQAIVRIGGSNLLKVLTDEYYNKKFKNIDVDFFTLKKFNTHSSFVSYFAVSLANTLGVSDTNDLMLAGLFHDVGLVAISFTQKSQMQNLINKCKETKADFHSAANLLNTQTHDSIGKNIAQKWNLSKRVVYLIDNHHSFETIQSSSIDSQLALELDLLMLADNYAHQMNFGFKDYVRDNALVSRRIQRRIGLSEEIVVKKAQEAAKVINSASW